MRFVVVTGIGRSGSTFLGDLLDRAPGTYARHEAIGSKRIESMAYYDPGHPLIRRELSAGREAMLAQARAQSAGCVVDVDHYLCYALDPLRELAPEVELFHLVRNGRAVVRSHWPRKTYTRWERTLEIVPRDPDTELAFAGWSRFQRLCWYWADVVGGLLGAGLPLLRYEDVVGDYQALERDLLEPAGIPLARETWAQARARRINPSRLSLKKWLRGQSQRLDWSAAREAEFQAICGPLMRRLGYE